MLYLPAARTTNANPLTFGGFGPQLPEDAVARGTVFVFATDHNGRQAYWEFRMLLRRQPGAQQAAVFTQIVRHGTSGTSTWVVTCSVDPANGQVQVTVTGAAGVTVDWLATTDDVLGMQGSFVP